MAFAKERECGSYDLFLNGLLETSKMAPPPEVARRNGMKGGRPTGPTTKISRARAIALVEQGNSPLDVMIDNMHFWHYRTRDLEEGIKKLLGEIKLLTENSTPDDVKLYLEQRQRA